MAFSVRSCLRVAAAVVLLLPLAHAGEPDENARKTARNFMAEGRELREEKNYKGALEAFKKAHAIMGVPTTGLEVARTLRLLGRLIEARKVATEVASMEPKPKEPEPFAVAREEAKKLVEELARLTPTLRINVKGDAKPEVRVDDVLVQDLSEVRVDPGTHNVTVRGSSLSKSAEVTVGEGETKELVFDLSPPPPATSSAPVTLTVNNTTSGKRTLMLAGYGLGGAGLVAGLATGFLAASKARTAKEKCDGTKCPPSAHADIDRGRAMATISNVAFAVAVVGAGVGTYALITKPKPTEERASYHLSPSVGFGHVGVEGTF